MVNEGIGGGSTISVTVSHPFLVDAKFITLRKQMLANYCNPLQCVLESRKRVASSGCDSRFPESFRIQYDDQNLDSAY